MKYRLLRLSLLSMLVMLFGGFSLAAILESDSGEKTATIDLADFEKTDRAYEVTKAGTSATGGDMELSTTDIVVTSNLGYAKKSEMSIYKTGRMTIALKEGLNGYIKNVTITLSASYPFIEPEGWDTSYSLNNESVAASTTSKVTDQTIQVFNTSATNIKALTLANASSGKTGIRKIEVTYVLDANSGEEPGGGDEPGGTEPEEETIANPYTYTFETTVFTEKDQTKKLQGVEWTLSMTSSGDGYFGYNSDKGEQFGKAAEPASALTLKTSDIPGTITKVKVNTSGAKDIVASFGVTVGETAFQFDDGTEVTTTAPLTSTATDYVFTGSAAGEVVISFSQGQTSSKAIYIKSIEVEYETTTEPAGFRDIKADLTSTSLIPDGTGEWTDVSTGIAVAEDGTLSRIDKEGAAIVFNGKWHGTKYGWANFSATVPVEGCVKITLGGSDYGSGAVTVTNSEGAEVAKIDNHINAMWSPNSPDNVAVGYYRTNAPTTLTFSACDYLPYFAVEAISEADLPVLPNNITLTYYDTDGTTVIGTQEIEGQQEIGQFKYDAADVTVAQGKAFRGWFAATTGGKKYTTADKPEADLSLFAVATDIEVAEADKTYTYNLTDEFFYAEDHEGFNAIGNGHYHNNHGWIFGNGDMIELLVSKKATITLTLCQYSAEGATITASNGASIGAKVDSDGATGTIDYEGDGGTLTLTVNSSGSIYIHAISVRNEATTQPQEPVVLIWDYTEKTIPTKGPDNGLYYGAYVNDAPSNNNGMNGVKLNNGGWAYFEKPAVAGTLTLTFGNRKNADAYTVNVSRGTLENGKGVKGDLIGEISINESPGSGSIELGADVTGVYIDRKTTAEGVLQKIVFKESVPRSFVDFEIPYASLTVDGYTGADLPTGVTFSGSFNDNQHGYSNATLVVPVDGTVKFTISGCQYANPATFTVKNAAGETLATLNQKEAGCFDNNKKSGTITYIYAGDATTLTFSTISYLSYFKAEACEVQEVTVTYKDQNGVVLGTKKVFEGEALGEVPYTEADLTIPQGEKFRGWVYNSGIKVKASDIVNGNISVIASVTPIETDPEVGTVQTYDLTQATFYPEDHENFNVTDGAYYNNHGFTFNAGGSFDVKVAGKAQIVLTLCQYGNGTTITITDAEGNVVRDDVPAKADADGGTTAVNYDGPATTLTFTFAAQTYLHKVTVYNVSDFIEKDMASGYYLVPANDAAGMILAINAAAAENGAKIFLPNGTYDLGETVLTSIGGNNVSIIGQSMDGVIIKNTPPISMEGLEKADLFLNTGTGLYLQDLTLQNALDYYRAGSAGRAVTLHDKGTKTINKNVRHLSHQDTYYSHKVGGLYYFEGGEIHGTVDYICGNGKAYFNEVTLVNEERSTATIVANSELYVFNNCTVENNADKWNLGRAWSDNPVCIYLNTTLKDPDRLINTRWNLSGINCDFSVAGEYGTKNASGEDITPASNTVTFTKGNTTMNTILTADQAATYTINYVLGDWATEAQNQTQQVDAPTAQMTDGTITWSEADGATAYAIFKNDVLVGITTETSFTPEAIIESAGSRAESTDTYTIRAANSRGGFGEPSTVSSATGINSAKNAQEANAIYNMQGVRVQNAQKGVYIVNGKKVVMK